MAEVIIGVVCFLVGWCSCWLLWGRELQRLGQRIRLLEEPWKLLNNEFISSAAVKIAALEAEYNRRKSNDT